MTQREVWCLSKGYNNRVQFRYRTSWEQTRWLGAITSNAFGTGKKVRQPRDLLTFPWEVDEPDRSKEIELIKERRKWRETEQ